jgi:nicotinate-nucleotide adenylyltransferase
VWWLVTPQNPLKPAKGMAKLATRLAAAEKIAAHPRIKVTSLESALGTRFTADTLSALKRRYPGTRFVWLMGADNLAEIHRWDRWTRIFHTLPVAVFARPTYCFKSLAGMAAHRFDRFRVPTGKGRRLAGARPPAWAFIWSRLNPLSATTIRNRGGRHAPSRRSKRADP